MKIRKSINILLIILISLFHFSPLSVQATEKETVNIQSQQDQNDIKQIVEIEETNTDEEALTEVIESEDLSSEKSSIEEEQELENQPAIEELENSNINGDTSDESSETQLTGTEDNNITNLSVQTVDILQVGDVDERVIELKNKLIRLGFGGMNVNATYGSFTAQRVSEFQAYYGLPANGITDEATFSKLDEILATPFQEGVRHEDTIELKEKLITLGYGGMNVNDMYGSFTALRVSQFQSDYGLKAHGIADEITLTKLDELFTVSNLSLQVGDVNDRVIDLKIKLIRLDFGGMNVNATYGSFTAQRVSQFQAYYGLPSTGIADEATFSKLDEILATPFQDGVRHPDTIELKKKLNWLGYGGMNLNDMYGSFTAQRVSQFQSAHGLKAHGIADGKTLEKMDTVLSTSFQVGGNHNSVIEFKRNLTRLGFGGMNLNSVYGSYTAQRVRELQSYYGLKVTGKGDIATLTKVETILSTPLQEGKRHNDTIQLKENLTRLGFGGMNLNTSYGSFTAQRVSQFQSYYGLRVNGIADDRTLEKINQILSSPFREGVSHQDTIKLKENLSRLGFGGMNLNTAYGSFTAQRVREFQSYYGLVVNGIADDRTLGKINEILNSPFQQGVKHKDTIKLKENLTVLGYGGMSLNETYGSFTAQRVREFQADNGLRVNGIADEVTLARISYEIKNRVVRIILDPGHGGRDSGAISNGLRESDVVLDVALRAAEVLRTQYVGVEVQLTRTNDTFVALEDRAIMANKWKANYFVSLHMNALNGSANGFETYIHNGIVSNETIQRQRDIHNFLINRIGIRDRGMRTADFSVLRNTNMPSILIEYMFIDNPTENRKLQDPNYRRWLGQITAEAIAQSFNLKKR
ncbi:peptidoglycan-binding protein [Alkalihalobacterium chitinilyticum]|uniref:Peptidoglycan-binding protein n=1 Tax=Alkalihalobacterium chitinilyticum TaxID=2980103 RepID=A0ABT5VK46_9BACI|nr:peptidoglycan-binding protein [Alkalihalobacterium chitinilyticum]MDE5415825.1 peptidoglycan-binding protein [Alkalihalobacterium chitinilyticum]